MALQISPAAPSATPRPPLAEPSAAPDADFARLMAQQQAAEPPQAGTPAPDVKRPRQEDPRTARGSATGTAPTPPSGTQARDEGAEAASGTRSTDDTDTETTPAEAAPLDPALAPWLAPLQRPAAEAAVTQASMANDAAVDALAPGKPARPAAAAPERAGQRAPELDARHTEAPAAGRTAAAAQRAADEEAATTLPPGADALRAASPTTPAAGTPPPSGVEALGTAPDAGAAASTPLEAPTPSAAVPVPLDAPDFGHAFGVQVSVLAREGVQQAELHLNPAEMGPVSVQIALDGERARIDFGAQAAATRAAIEASLPELAAALRDAGLTLAGGGVSQGFGQRGGAPRDGTAGERGDSRPGRVESGAAAPARPAWRGRARAGGVDLYA